MLDRKLCYTVRSLLYKDILSIKNSLNKWKCNLNINYLVCPTKDRINVSSNWVLSTFKGHMPFTPGRSMLACSCMPIPFLIILKEPSLNAPEQVTNCKKMTHFKTLHNLQSNLLKCFYKWKWVKTN